MKVLVATVVSIAVATSVSARHDSVRPLAVSAEARAAMTRYGLEAYENGDAMHPVHALLYTSKAWLPAALLLLAIPIVCVFYTAPSVKWMLDNTIPRLVWYLLAVPLAATLRGPRFAGAEESLPPLNKVGKSLFRSGRDSASPGRGQVSRSLFAARLGNRSSSCCTNHEP